ncbi:MAG: YchF/TatD family DNA exonuclease [Nitrospirota bacterium]
MNDIHLIDTHAHLDMKEYDHDRDEVLARADASGVKYLITIGTNPGSSAAAVQLAEAHERIYAAIGIHPHDAKDFLPTLLPDFRALAMNKKVVACGEIGLDYHYDLSPRDIQQDIFRIMLREAKALGLPIIVHDRDAHDDMIKILSEEWDAHLGGVMHCFSGDVSLARTFVDMGFLISIAGPVTFPKAEGLREVVRQIPIEHLLIETDAPYLAPQPMRGKRNEPAFVRYTAEEIARLKGLSLCDIARITTYNAMRMFRIGEVMEEGLITYPIRNSLYLNITNRCTASCTFCVRYDTDFVKGHNLRLKKEPSVQEIIAQIGDPRKYDEVVFCGYGEPFIRFDVILAVSREVKRRGGKIRIDTNGHANLIHGRNVLPELSGLVDAMSVSLNAQNAELYAALVQPEFGEKTYEAVKDFIRLAKQVIPDVSVTVVALPAVDIDACRKIAEELGVRLRVRDYNVVG